MSVIVLIETFVFANIWLIAYNEMIVLPFVLKGNLLLYAVYAILLVTFLKSFDGIALGRYQKSKIIIAHIMSTVFSSLLTYLIIVLLAADVVTVWPLALLVAINTAVGIIFTLLGDRWLSRLFPPKKTLIIYDSYSPDVFIDKLAMRKDKFVLKKILALSELTNGLESELCDVDCVILFDLHTDSRNDLLKICFENNVRAYSTTKISDVLVRGAEVLHMFDTPLLLYRNNGLTIEQKMVKRLMDITLSALALVITSPILLITALLIKLSDGGPVFFRQERATLNGKTFRIHKFRTMIVDAEKDGKPQPAVDNDPRITPLGSFLRKTRIDELPQFIDILAGNMSLVGPRPERIEHVLQYTEQIPEFEYRLKMRGGLTGLAQLYGKYNTAPYDKIQLDLMYMQNYSLLLDIKLLLMTFKIIFIKESTDGFDRATSKRIKEKSKKNKKGK